MRQSKFFTKTSKTFPEDEETKNALFLIKGGFISKASSGVYSILPLGLRVLNKINSVVREEMNAIGAEEMLMPALVDRKFWEKSGRWRTDVVYCTGRKKEPETGLKEKDFEFGLGWSHEEVIADIATSFIQSYKDLPKGVYQIQTKFRAEKRAQGGLLRGREFLMKDLYSFHESVKDLDKYYETVIQAYRKILKKLSLKAFLIEASGGAFTEEYTHEFQVLNPAGEDTVYYCGKCGFGQNKEVYAKNKHKKCDGEIKKSRAIEVANVFKLGTKYSESFNLVYSDKNGDKHRAVMGSYGFGLTRTMGAIVEEFNDDKGIIWPEVISPFSVHLLNIRTDSKPADKVYGILKKAGVEVLYDDRKSVTPGEKFADADLIGIPYRILISEKTGTKAEVKKRNEKKARLVSIAELIKLLPRNQ